MSSSSSQAGEAAAEREAHSLDSQEGQIGDELRDLTLEDRQPSASSLSEAGGGGDGGEGGATAAAGEASTLFECEDEEEAAAATGDLPQAGAGTPPAELAAALRAATSAASEAAPAPGEAAADAALRHQPKHVFVFSTAGKPIYAYRKDEAALAGLMATAEAILSVAHSKGHTLRHIRVGSHVFAFLERPPLCLVGVSAYGEPPAVLRMQLSLVHGQIVSLLTSSALTHMFERNPGYDARRLLAGSEGMLCSLIDSFTATPAALLGAYPSLPLLGGVRQALLASLAAAVKATGAVHGVVVAGGAVAAACPAPGAAPLQQWDLLLLLNLLSSNQSFRHSGDAMTPVCLPRFNPAANLHAYIHYSDGATQTATVLLCGGMPDPGALAAAQQRMQQQLEAIGVLQALISSAAAEQHMAASNGGSGGNGGSSSSSSSSSSAVTSLLAVPSLPTAAGGGRFGATPLLHFVYKLSARQQYVMAPFSQPLLAGGLQQPITVAYSQLRAAMFEGSAGSGGPLQRLRFEARPRVTLLGAVTGDTELYLALDPLTDKAEAAGVAGRLGMWLFARHDQLFSL
ncbi:SAND-like isoform X1 [Chlorella sorokiniana]|uniref:Vacuolar fusion protein MON1 homolog n=1 Tax=Chlorella sorokiniana TaxID=3076 RepID=A0A2P6TEG5_CHLSO|nr:SAND-like isoform X1 [Chlorella sorokiniana]|eukprot:PRW21034.1 SAND-like isoform X1 [Chlorella sorokiniana]